MTSKRSAHPDPVLSRIADYVVDHKIPRAPAYKIARYCLLDALACAFYALASPECTKLLGPVVRGTVVPKGSRVPGTNFELDPVKAAFDIGTAIRWLDFNDYWYAAEAGHLSDNLGAILAVADYVSRNRAAGSRRVLKVQDVLTALIKAYEIQGVLALKNSFVDLHLESGALLNVTSSAVATHLLGGSRGEIINAISNAWMDGVGLKLYRQGHNTGSRKSWSEADSVSRGVRHALFAVNGEMGYPAVLSAPQWGFCDALMRGKPIVLGRPLDSFMVENILFKIPFPTQFHPQTASECAVKLHPLVKHRIADITKIHMRTHGKAMKTSDRKGPLHNPAQRDHSMQYIVAIALLHGRITGSDYEDETAADPRIDALRDRMVVTEDKSFTRGYEDPERRTNPSAMRIEFRDGTSTPEIQIDYPLGHPRRRREGLPVVEQKFRRSVELTFPPKRQRQIMDICSDAGRLKSMPFEQFMDMLVK